MAAIGRHAHWTVGASPAAAGLAASARGSGPAGWSAPGSPDWPAPGLAAWSAGGSPGWPAPWPASKCAPAARAAACRACCARSESRPAVKSAVDRSSASLAASGISPYLGGAPGGGVPGGCSERGRGASRARGRLAASRRSAALFADRGVVCTAAIEDLPAGRAWRWRAMHPDRVDDVHLDHRRPGHAVIAHRVDDTDAGGVGHDLGPPRAGVHDPGDQEYHRGGHQADAVAPLDSQVHQDDGGDDEPRPGQDDGSGAAEHLRLAVRVLP